MTGEPEQLRRGLLEARTQLVAEHWPGTHPAGTLPALDTNQGNIQQQRKPEFLE